MSSEAQNPEINEVRSAIDSSVRGPVLALICAGAAWLVVATLLSLYASIKFHSPDFLSGSFLSSLHFGRLKPAAFDALLYGWGVQAAAGVSIWIMSRLCRVPLSSNWLIHLGVWMWNIATTIGIFGILFGGNTSITWLEFPDFVWPILLIAYVCITAWVVLAFRVRNAGESYISQWYILGACFWFPWTFATANIMIRHFDGNGVMANAISAWYSSSVVLLFFVPVGLASVYYMIPKVTGKPIRSYHLAIIGFWTLAFLSGWAGVQRLMGGPVPAWMATAGQAATLLMLIPVGLVALNHHLSMRGKMGLVQYSPTLRFTVFGAIAYTVMSVVGVLLCTFKVGNITLLTPAMEGFDLLALYGFFSMAMFGAIYFILPRLSECEWPSGRLANFHFWFTTYGLVALIAVKFIGGIFTGGNLVDPSTWSLNWNGVVSMNNGFAIGSSVAWVFLTLANIAFFFHIVLMALRLGKRSTSPTMFGQPHAEPAAH